MRTRKTRKNRAYTPLLFLFGKHPDGVPAAYWEYLQDVRWVLVVACAVILGVGIVSFGALFAMIWFGIHDALALLREKFPMLIGSRLPLISFAALAVHLVVPAMMRSRYRRFIEGHDYEVCTNCGYQLTGLPRVHVCSECGRPFDIESVRQEWKRWFAQRGIWSGGLWG